MDFEGLTDNANKVIRNTFGILISYTPQSGSAISVRAVFDRAYLEVDPETQAVVQSTQPVLLIRTAELPAAPRPGDRCVVKGETYRIATAEPDGYGNYRMRLGKL